MIGWFVRIERAVYVELVSCFMPWPYVCNLYCEFSDAVDNVHSLVFSFCCKLGL